MEKFLLVYNNHFLYQVFIIINILYIIDINISNLLKIISGYIFFNYKYYFLFVFLNNKNYITRLSIPRNILKNLFLII
jgi:hypothetical protein